MPLWLQETQTPGHKQFLVSQTSHRFIQHRELAPEAEVRAAVGLLRLHAGHQQNVELLVSGRHGVAKQKGEFKRPKNSWKAKNKHISPWNGFARYEKYKYLTLIDPVNDLRGHQNLNFASFGLVPICEPCANFQYFWRH